MLLRRMAGRVFLMLPASLQGRVQDLRLVVGRWLVRSERRWGHLWPGTKAVEYVESVESRYIGNGEYSSTKVVGTRVRQYAKDSTLHWIDPARILYTAGDGLFTIQKQSGWVVGGDWDLRTKRFEDRDFYGSLQERISKGIPWHELPYYHRVLRQIEEGRTKWDCNNREDLDQRCQFWDGLYEQIRTIGFKSQMDLREEGQPYNLDDEITVNIGRDGDLLFCNGRHRLACAKVAGVTRVPVRILVRHAEWEEFKGRILSYAAANPWQVYAPLTHIDLQSIPSSHSHQRFEMIKENIGHSNQTILDIGANWGYFCHRFEEEGYGCFAVEKSEKQLYFLRKLKRAEYREFSIITESILDLGEKGSLKYDVVLALSIFHHFLKTEHAFRQLKTLLGNLDTNEMFFEPHLYSESQMAGAFANFTPDEFVQFILDNSRLNRFELLGVCDWNRPLYKLWR